MPGPQELSQAMSSFFDVQVMGAIFKYVGYGVLFAVVGIAVILVYHLLAYKYKVTYPILYYDKEKKIAKIVGFKRDRARDVKKDDVRKQRLLFKRQTIEPFKEEDILPGKKINVLKINEDGTYVAMPDIRFNEDISQFEQLSPEEKYWAVLQLKENAKAFASEDAQKRAMIITVCTVAFCMIAVVITVYLSLKSPERVVDSFNTWGGQFLNVAKSMGGTPPG